MKPPITKRDHVTPYMVFTFLPGFWLGFGWILRERIKRVCGAWMCEECEGCHIREKCRVGGVIVLMTGVPETADVYIFLRSKRLDCSDHL